MRIGIDAHYIGRRAGGNETYTRQLLRGLKEAGTAHDLFALVHPGHRAHVETETGVLTHPLPETSSYLRVPVVMPWLARRLRLDLLHLQYTAPPVLPPRYVVTLHDNVAFRFPETMPFADRNRLRLFSARTLRKAQRVLTVTNAMREDLSSFFGLDPQYIHVTPNALDERFLAPVDETALAHVHEKYRLPDRYVLYLGLIQPRKNLGRLARAFAQVKHEFPHALVIAGKRAWMHEPIMRELHALGLGERLIFTEYVDGEDLPALYAGADVFAFPSLYEGFGIPVTEAIACGTPVLASTAAALVEVAGGGALHIDPTDVSGMGQALLQLLHDEKLRASLLAAGQHHVRQYTPRLLGERTLAAYDAALHP